MYVCTADLFFFFFLFPFFFFFFFFFSCALSGGLDEKVDEAVLQAAFIPFGEVVQMEIPRDVVTKKHRGFAFVEYADAVRRNVHASRVSTWV